INDNYFLTVRRRAEELKKGFGCGDCWRFDLLAHILAGENNGRSRFMSNLCEARAVELGVS
ncbi:MAG: hypothetical protein WCD04_21455, partial [Terriglobia bacterium]